MNIEAPLKNTPLSTQVIEIIIKRIKDGTYPPGSQIPPENDLAQRFDVSRSTIRKAMSALTARGMVVQKHGVGTFVSNISQINNPLNEAVEFNDLISRFGHQPEVLFTHVNLIKANEQLAESLKIKTGEQILRSHKIFTADEIPVIYVVNSIPTSLFPKGLVEKVLATPDITEPLYGFLEDHCRERIEYHIASLKSIIARQADFPDLPLGANEPLLVIEEVAYNVDETALWHSKEYFPQNNLISFNVIRIRN